MQNIIIAAGGTGGHIFPALAMAKALQTLDPSLRIHFVGARGGMEQKIIPAQGYSQSLLPIGRLNHNVSRAERCLTLLQLPVAIVMSLWILLRRRPRFVLGVGGHSSAPILLAAALLRYRTFIWEPNAIPGLANRWLSRFVDESLVVFPEAKRFLKTARQREVGMPVRSEIESLAASDRETAAGPFHILVFGGSQGARGINNAVSQMIREGGPWLKNVRIVHQTGPYDFDRIREMYAGASDADVEVREFLTDMDRRYAWADLVVCRSGTGTLSELAACGKPAILIPLPTAADDHQRKNAEVLVRAGGARLITQKDLTPKILRDTIEELLSAPGQLREMGRKMRAFHKKQAAEEISRYLLAESAG